MSNNDKQVLVSLAIPADEYLRVYQGSAKTVSTTDNYGRRIRFPVGILQPYVTRDGINGIFAIEFDADNKFTRIVRVN